MRILLTIFVGVALAAPLHAESLKARLTKKFAKVNFSLPSLPALDMFKPKKSELIEKAKEETESAIWTIKLHNMPEFSIKNCEMSPKGNSISCDNGKAFNVADVEYFSQAFN